MAAKVRAGDVEVVETRGGRMLIVTNSTGMGATRRVAIRESRTSPRAIVPVAALARMTASGSGAVR